MTATRRIFDICDEKDGAPNWLVCHGSKYYGAKDLLDDVDKFLTELGKDRIIAVNSHSSAEFYISRVIVWYWG
jgi:hypothetical protein